MTYQWLTRTPNPRTHNPLNQEGYVIHAVAGTESNTLEQLRNVRSLCGLRPRYGWSFDIFMEQKCRKCAKIAGFWGINETGETK